MSIIERLLQNVSTFTFLPTLLAVPEAEVSLYRAKLPDVYHPMIVGGSYDPLTRMIEVSLGYDTIVRVCHDKIFVDRLLVSEALALYEKLGLQYLFSSALVAGAGFEIIDCKTLVKASQKIGRPCEDISYAVRLTRPRMHDYREFAPKFKGTSGLNFLIDHEEDVSFMRCIFAKASTKSLDLSSAIDVAETYPELCSINAKPLVTVYTCVFNEEELISDCIDSVFGQSIRFPALEYIVIDDASTDDTALTITKHRFYPRLRYYRNDLNVGLASSSNRAIELARGRFIIRMDANDAFLFPFTLAKMVRYAETHGVQALYPMFVDDRTKTVKLPQDHHHPGGCLFLTKALRDFLFTDRLRGHDGLDLFTRISGKLKVDYYTSMPVFFYRYKASSLSNQDLMARDQIRYLIESGVTGGDLMEEIS